MKPRERPLASSVRRSRQVPSSPSSSCSRNQACSCGNAGNIELRDDVGALATGAHHARIAAFAQRQRQCVNQDGLARSGFAGKRGEAGQEIELEGIDDDEIANNEVLEHL